MTIETLKTASGKLIAAKVIRKYREHNLLVLGSLDAFLSQQSVCEQKCLMQVVKHIVPKIIPGISTCWL